MEKLRNFASVKVKIDAQLAQEALKDEKKRMKTEDYEALEEKRNSAAESMERISRDLLDLTVDVQKSVLVNTELKEKIVSLVSKLDRTTFKLWEDEKAQRGSFFS